MLKQSNLEIFIQYIMDIVNFFTMQKGSNEKYIAMKKFSKAIETTFLDFLGDTYFGI